MNVAMKQVHRGAKLRLVKSGSIAAGDNKLDYTSDNSFIEFGVDLTSYHGNHKIVVTDSAGKSASGYLHSVAPGGETLGDELLDNPTFDSDMAGWNVVRCIAASVSGGVSNNCAEVTYDSGNRQGIYDSFSLPSGSLYYFGAYIKSGTSGNESYFIQSSDTPYVRLEGTSSGVWFEHKGYCTLVSHPYFYLYKNTATEGTMLFDEASVKPVTDCAATGALIVSTLGGATRSWTSVDTGFNPNLACDWQIFRVR